MSLENYRWTCSCCGKEMVGLPMDVAFKAPSGWDTLSDEDRKASMLGDDFCRMVYADGRIDHFIRGLMLLPVNDLEEDFGFGVWVSVSEKSWNIYDEGFDSGDYAFEQCFGYLMHDIPGFPNSFLMHCNVKMRPGNLRPLIELQDTEHPLGNAQCRGVDVGYVERWVRPHLVH